MHRVFCQPHAPSQRSEPAHDIDRFDGHTPWGPPGLVHVRDVERDAGCALLDVDLLVILGNFHHEDTNLSRQAYSTGNSTNREIWTLTQSERPDRFWAG